MENYDNICINVNIAGDGTSISRGICTVDPLATMIEAFADAVRGAGYGDDSRFSELVSKWEFLNEDTIEDDSASEAPAAPYYTQPYESRIGDIVEVVRETYDSDDLNGRVGRVVDTDGYIVRFPGWSRGHGKNADEWCCDPSDLRLVSRE